MQDIVCRAIATKQLLKFDYKGYERVVEPHAYSELKTGNDALRCYQVEGGSESGNPIGWKLMLIAEISDIEILDETFSGPRAGYRPGDSHMRRIYCEL